MYKKRLPKIGSLFLYRQFNNEKVYIFDNKNYLPMDMIQNLLTQVHTISEQYEKVAQATGENFNIFKVMGLQSSEVRLHSKLLAELLNPKKEATVKVMFF